MKIFFLIVVTVILGFNIYLCTKIEAQLNQLEQISDLNINIARQHTKLIYYNQSEIETINDVYNHKGGMANGN